MGVATEVRRVLRDLPPETRKSVDAELAIALAKSVDAGEAGAAAAKELRSIVQSLRAQTPAEGDALDDLAARRAARRGA